jgi:outer membrane protein TolC
MREQAEAGLELSAERAKSDYMFAIQQYETETENMSLAQTIRDRTRIKYQEGVNSSFELNEMENQFIQAQGRKIQASLNLLNALTAFQKAYNTL